MSLFLPDEAATLACGARLADALARIRPAAFPASGLHLHLRGSLGAGKTTLVRGMLRALGETGPVKSPTYTLMEPYQVAGLRLFHFDLYRIADPDELEFLGARDEFRPGSVCVFEWPERGEAWLPRADLVLALEARDAGREVTASAVGGPGETLAEAVLAAARC